MPARLSIAAAAFGLGAATALATVVNVGLLSRSEASDGAGQLSARRIVTLIERSAEEKLEAAEAAGASPSARTARPAPVDVRPSGTPSAEALPPTPATRVPSLPLPGAVAAQPRSESEPDGQPTQGAGPSPTATPSASPTTSPSGSPSTTPSPSASPSTTPESTPTPGRDDRASSRRETTPRGPIDRRDDLVDRLPPEA